MRLRLTPIAIVATLVLMATAAPRVAASVTIPPGSLAIPSSGTFLYLNSQPGSYVGGGTEHLYTPPTADARAMMVPGSNVFTANFTLSDPIIRWSVYLSAPPGAALTVGSYTGAAGYYAVGRTGPGMSVFGDGGCNNYYGQFDVTSLSFAPTGELLLFDATFEQRCDPFASALYGRVRIENPAPTPGVTVPAGSIAVPTSGSFLYLNSEVGDYAGGWIEQLFTGSDSVITGKVSDDHRYVDDSVDQAYSHWRVYIAAPVGSVLAVGSYISATGASDHPGLAVSGPRGCSIYYGKFDVDELLFWPSGDLRTFQATFEQHCDGAAAALYGRIRVEMPPPPPPLVLTVAINDPGTVRFGQATITGTLTCSRPVSVVVVGGLTQTFGNGSTVAGAFTAVADCAASGVWSGFVIPQTQYGDKFLSGSGDVTSDASSCDLHCYTASATATIKLNAGTEKD